MIIQPAHPNSQSELYFASVLLEDTDEVRIALESSIRERVRTLGRFAACHSKYSPLRIAVRSQEILNNKVRTLDRTSSLMHDAIITAERIKEHVPLFIWRSDEADLLANAIMKYRDPMKNGEPWYDDHPYAVAVTIEDPDDLLNEMQRTIDVARFSPSTSIL